MRLYGLLGGMYVFVCKACDKLWGSRGICPWEILILDLLLDANWWNMRLVCAQTYFTIYCVIIKA